MALVVAVCGNVDNGDVIVIVDDVNVTMVMQQ